MTRSRFRFPNRAGLLACALGMAGLSATSQELPGPLTPSKDAPANFDPSDVYFQGWLLSRDAEKLQAEKKHAEALEKLMRARELFGSVSSYYPLWKPDMVKGRKAKTQEIIDLVGPLALEENKRKNDKIAELEGGAKTGFIEGAAPMPLNNGIPAAPVQPAREVETLETRRIAELENRVKELQSDLAAANKPQNQSQNPNPNPSSADREASRSRDMAKQRDLAQAELKRAHDELAKLRARFAEQPMQEEMRNLANRLQDTERQRAALGQALSQSQQETRQAREQAEALNVERGRLAQKASDLERNLDQERKVQNDVIAGQQKQLRAMQDELRGKNDELDRANQRILGLESDLASLKKDHEVLRDERDNLLRERDHMKALLASEDGDRIQKVIDQNMDLARQLREANETVTRLNKDHNATQDELIEAMRDLALAKDNINAFKREKTAQDQRIADLERRLRSETAALAAKDADPAEAEMLRAIIQKQIRIQERRRQSAELLVDAVGAKAEKDDKIKEAFELFKGTEMVLSPQEAELVKDRSVDDEFTYPGARSQPEVDASIAELEGGNRPFIDASTRAFVAGRYQSSRELFEMVLDQNPGDTGTMCKLGVVHLHLKEPQDAAKVFRNATVIDSNNPYAHRMLGLSLMRTGDYGEAQEALKRSVTLAPTHAEGRVVLGKLCFDLGQEEEAEKEFKAAINFDDAMSDSYFNLAYLYAKQGKKKQGREYYQMAMERGAQPDPELDKRLANKP
ncbi:tetratricopeptide repeat protein [Luteolibacter arcticus]|uniref:Tetratricopeptide repeat protein n=1 Tax=Luteolibacter arcticus TaxID=1581411 RepID=A0ABT3GBD2_9BACT|nr:tetratricopeptide repeat protein [Luteolibacter arcticus]MCW1920933.1 tetratricopeptide repeat protein [Luteolibacter arcticus]